ncbi:MAG: hypothetical protein LBQ54_08415, partial [Planctomycetaceae bacterium]|nr:hypothetical protein [Planctomycetaceae bacterium]
MSVSKSFYQKILRLLFHKPEQQECPARQHLRGFELLENRELLSASPWQRDMPDLTSDEDYTAAGDNFAPDESVNMNLDDEPDDNIYGAFLEEEITGFTGNEWHQMESLSAQNDECDFAGGSIGITTASSINVIEGQNAVINLNRSDAIPELGALMNIPIYFQISTTITSLDGTTTTSSYESYFIFPAGTSSYAYQVGISNDSIPELSETTITFTLLSAVASPHEYSVSSSVITINVIDNDHWKVCVEASDPVATERLTDVTPDYGEYTITRTHDISGVTGDTTYAVTVNFDMVYDSNLPESVENNQLAAASGDYSLQYQQTNGDWASLSYTAGPGTSPLETRYHYSVTIPA